VRVLLDTCVVSELQRKKPDPRVRRAVQDLRAEDLFLSVVTVGELTKGIALLRAGKKKTALEDWLEGLTGDSSHLLPIDMETARIWGELTARAHREGEAIPVADGLIAATAIQHGMRVMTRNTRDFAASGADLIDPWAD